MENRMDQRRAKRHKRALRQKSLLIFLCLGLTFSPFSTLAEGNEEPEGDSEGTEETESQETENGEEEEVNGETLEEETQESEDVSEEGTEEEDTSENEENTTENSESEESVNEEETDSSDSSESTSNTSEEAVEEDSGNETDSGGAEASSEEAADDAAPDTDETDDKQENASSENDEVTEENQVAGEADKASDEEHVGAASVESSEEASVELLADSDFEWEENNEGNATITGYAGADSDVVIPEEIDGLTVTMIGQEAFRNEGITSVEFSNSVTGIGMSAFRDNQLTTVDFPDSLELISLRAFQNNELETLVLNENLNQIEGYAFQDNQLTEVDFGEDINAIFSGAFQSNQLEEVVLPDSISIIQSSVFRDNQITSLTISDNVWLIAENAFSGNQLSDIQLPESLERIRREAFRDNDLVEIEFPDEVHLIEESAFAGNELTDLFLPETVETVETEAFTDNQLSDVTVANDSVELQGDLFLNNQADPADLTIAGFHSSTANTYADDYGHTFDALDVFGPENDFLWKDNSDGTVTITDYTGSGTDIVIPEQLDEKDVRVIDEDALRYKGLEEVSIPDTVEEIHDYAFAHNHLTSVDLPDSVVEIAYRAFYENKLTEIDFPNQITVFRNGAFSNNELESINLPDSLEELEVNVFRNNELTSVKVPEGVTHISSYAFADNQISDVTLPASLESIESNGWPAFLYNPVESIEVDDDNQQFKDINQAGLYTKDGTAIVMGTLSGEIDSEAEVIHRYAFAGLDDLTEITIPDTIKEIDFRAFIRSGLTTVDIPESVVEVGSWAFEDNDLTHVTVRNEQMDFGDDVFEENQTDAEDLVIEGFSSSTAQTYADENGHTFSGTLDFQWTDNNNGTATITDYLGSAQEVSIPETIHGLTVTGIGVDAFSYKDLTSVELPDTVTSIGLRAFEHNSIEEVTFPEGLTFIGPLAFNNNEIVDLALPDSLSAIGFSAFLNNGMTSVTFGESLEVINFGAFRTNDLTEVSFPDGLKEIGNNAFRDNELTNVHLPDTIETLGNDAFRNSMLESVTVVNPELSFGEDVFLDNQDDPADFTIEGFASSTSEAYADEFGHSFEAIPEFEWEERDDGTVRITGYNGFQTDITIPDEIAGEPVTAIGAAAFEEMGLTSIEIPDSVDMISNRAFQHNHLEHVTLPENLEVIGHFTFAWNDLNSVTFNDSLEYIESFAFESNELSEVDLPESLVWLSGSVFAYNNLTEVTIPEGISRIGTRTFQGNDLVSVTIPENIETVRNLAFANNELAFVEILNQTTELENQPFEENQSDPEELLIRGYDPSTAKEHAEDEGFSFDPINLMVVEVPALDDADVVFGTSLADLPLPEEVDVELNNDEQQTVSVTWNEGEPVYDGESTGDYAFEGSLDLPDEIENPAMLSPSLTVTVSEITVYEVNELDSVSVDYGTSRSDLALPEEVDVELSDESTAELAVTWNDGDPAYDGTSPGSYAFTGTLDLPDGVVNPDDETAEMTIVVDPAEVTSVTEPAPVEVAFGTALADLPLPEDIEVTLNDGSTRNVSVAWDEGTPPYDEYYSGEYVFTGMLMPDVGVTGGVSAFNVMNLFDATGTIMNPDDLQPEMTVTVEAPYVTDVADPEPLNVGYGKALSDVPLPEDVEVTLNDGTTMDVPVSWEEGDPAYDGNTPGDYPFTGTPDVGASENDGNEVVLAENEALLDMITNPDDLTAELIVTVDEPMPVAVEQFETIEVPFGTPRSDLDLPEEGAVTFEDGSEKVYPIEWDESVPEYDEERFGSYAFYGELQGSEFEDYNEVHRMVIVLPPEDEEEPMPVAVEQFDPIEVPFGTLESELDLPAEGTVTYEDGSEDVFAIEWVESDPDYDGEHAGTYFFRGILQDGIGDEFSAVHIDVILLPQEEEPVEEKPVEEETEETASSKEETLPQTNQSTTMSLYMAGALLILLASMLMTRKRKQGRTM